METLTQLEELGYKGMLGLIKAKRDGIITEEEYRNIKDYCNKNLNADRHWYRVLVFARGQ